MIRLTGVLAAAALLLGACGTAPQERGLSGAGIGAAGGAIVGAVTGLTVVEGAAIGAAAGALAGVLVDEKKLNLGEPAWKRWLGPAQGPAKEKSSGAAPRERHAGAGAQSPQGGQQGGQLVAGTQWGLKKLGYDPGPVDGIWGPRTRAAARAYQKDHGLAVDGRPTRALALHIQARLDGQLASQGLYN